MLIQSFIFVPMVQSLMWSIAADAADAALDRPLALMISAPLFCTRGINSFLTHYSPRELAALSPLRFKSLPSGYWVVE